MVDPTPIAEPSTADEQVGVTGSGPGFDDLPEHCLLGGLLGGLDIQKVVEGIDDERRRWLEQREVEHEREAGELAEEMAGWVVERKEIEERLKAVRQLMGDQHAQLAQLQQLSASSRRTRRVLTSRLARRRFAYPVRLMERRVREQVEMGRQLAEALAQSERTFFELDREHHEYERQRRELNKEEFERRSQELRRRRQRIDDQLVALDTKLARLQQLGITPKTHGFLIWAGYLSFPAFGWFVGEAIRAAASSEESLLNELVTLLAKCVVSASEALGGAATVGVVILLPILLLAVWAGWIFASDRLLSRFDRSWKRRRGRSGKSSGWITIPHSTIERADYTQVLAKVPLYYAWAMVPIGLAALMALSGGGDNLETLTGLWTKPGEALFYTFLGGTLAVVVAAFLMLYCSRVIEARLAEGDTQGWRQLLLTNFELVAVLASAVIAVLVQAVMGSLGVQGLWLVNSAPGVLLLLVLGGFVVAYGLMFKGLFQSRRAVLEELHLLDEELGRYEGAPAVRIDDGEWSEYRQRMRELYREIEERWRQVELYDRPRLGLHVLARAFEGGDDRSLRLPYRSLDTLIEPEIVSQIDEVSLEGAEVEAQAAVLEAEVQRLRGEADRYEADDRNLADRIASGRQKLGELSRQFAHETFRLNRVYRNLIVRCETAFEMGRGLRSSGEPSLKMVSA